jgi:hypothetical protein
MASKSNLSGKVAVITGASSGIGLCYCRELASRGCAIVMVSNQQKELEDYSLEISGKYSVAVYTLFCDLTAQDADKQVLQFIDDHGIEADYLINNAGIFSFREVTKTPEGKINCFIDLHVRAVTSLSRAFAIRFAERGKGRILNMSSMSCWMPMPGIAMYSATKAYIRVFTRALYYEMRDSGVSVTVACPGGIATDLFGLPKNLQRLALHLHAIQTPEKFVAKAVDQMLKGKKQYINGWLNRLSIFFIAITPTPVRMLIKRLMLDKNIVR